ncbi:Proliferating cell nuclear antigen, partial [Bienertia sinuspersici]
MAKPSIQKPETNMSFQLNSNNLLKLQRAIVALCDSEFNPRGVAMVDVNEKGFEIMVRATETNAAANLFLKASGLINFHCNKPIVSKMINLTQISDIVLNDAVFDDFVTVIHLDEFTSNLSFKFGNDPEYVLSIEFLENDMNYQKFPNNIQLSCEATIKSSILREIIDQNIKIGEIQLVSAQISEIDAETEETEDECNAWFELRHLMSLMKASTVANRFDLCFFTEPSENVMFRFKLEEFGRLVFVQKAILISKDPELAKDADEVNTVEELVRIASDY